MLRTRGVTRLGIRKNVRRNLAAKRSFKRWRVSYFLRRMRVLLLVMGVPMALVFIYSNYIQNPRKLAGADPIIRVESTDTEITRARDQAQETLPQFIEHLERPAADEKEFRLKFRLPAAETDEFIWGKDIQRAATGGFVVTIDGTPRTPNYKNNQRLVIRTQDVNDWGYRKGTVMQGNFTTKVLVTRLAPAEQAKVRAFLGW